MKDLKNPSMNYNGTSITKNSLYNLLGFIIPSVFAIFIIPTLIKGLGIERFGILNLAWIVIGYFSFFDFGIGKSLTKIISEKLGENKLDQIPSLFWTSLFLMLGVSVILVLILIFFVPQIVDLFNITPTLHSEFLSTFYLLILAIPLVATTAGLRGVLEAYQKFFQINLIRVFLGIFTFLIPLLCLVFTKNIFWVVLFLILIRIIVWILYFRLCFKVHKDLKNQIKFEIKLVSTIYKFSAWITIANIVGPIISNIDRILISVIISAKALAYYATPYEMIVKLLIIPDAMVAVLFPVFSASFFNNKTDSKKLFYSGVKFIFLFIYPIVLLVITFANEGIELWIGSEFAKESSIILQILAFGILFNAISYIPFNYFQGVGQPHIPALLSLIELPLYLIFMFFFIQNWGLKGAAIIWLVRIILDTGSLFFLTYIKFQYRYNVWIFIVAIVFLMIPFIFESISMKMIYTTIILFGFLILYWNKILSIDEKRFLISQMMKI